MATPTADKLRIFFPSTKLTADDQPLPQLTVASAAAANELVCAGLTEADDFWNGAIGWFDPDTATVALRGIFFHVRDFVAADDKLIFSRNLPAVPAASDTFRLVLGGNYRSSQETFGLLVGGVLPEFSPVAGVNITGLTIKKAAPKLGAGTLTLSYDQAAGELYIKMDDQSYGVGLDVSADVADGIVFAEDGQSFIQVDVVAASLPGTSQIDTFTLQYPKGTLCPDFEGYETQNGAGGKTRYRLEVVKNTDPAEPMVDFSVFAAKPAGDPTVSLAGEALGLDAGAIEVGDATGWPTRGFWIRNNAQGNDVRYVIYRSGNVLHCAAVDWAVLNFQNGTDEIFSGDQIEDDTTGATAVVDQVFLLSGTWGGGDAAGKLLLKKVEGDFGDDHPLIVAPTYVANSDGVSVRGLREKTAVAWGGGEGIELMPDVDLGANYPGGGNQFKDIGAEYLDPGYVDFASPGSEADALALYQLGPGVLLGIWRREWIMPEHQPRADVAADTHYLWS